MAAKTKRPSFTEADVLHLAAEAQLSPRTARKALEKGAGALRAIVDQNRVADAARKLHLDLPVFVRPSKNGASS